jgi:hypothetical protein
MRKLYADRVGFTGCWARAALTAFMLCGCAERGASPPRSERSAADLTRFSTSISEREYHASVSREGLQAPNRRQNLRSHFDGERLRVVDRRGDGQPYLFELALVGRGRGSALAEVERGLPRARGARVEIARGDLVEWYENRPEGLEHGFRMIARPPGEGWLALAFELRGARAALDGADLVFESESGRSLRYAALAAVDAAGRALPARFELGGETHFRIAVDDGAAQYPIEIDPLLFDAGDAEPALEGNQIGAAFGGSVAAAGDVDGDGIGDLVVGAPQYDAGEADEGAVFVFLGTASGIASGTAASAAAQLEGDQAGAHLGTSVAGAGDVDGDGFDDVIAGAPDYTHGENSEGVALLFLGSATGIADAGAAAADALFEADQADASLGVSVAGGGDVDADGHADILLGAPDFDGPASDSGAAFLFRGSATGIANGSPTSASAQFLGDATSAVFGTSVALVGSVNGDAFADLAIGAPNFDAGQTNEGGVFVFHGSATGIQSGGIATADSQLEGDRAGILLGSSVSAAGDVDGDGLGDLIAGAPRWSDGEFLEGAAFVFRGTATGITDAGTGAAATRLEGDQIGAQFGLSVAAAGNTNFDAYADVLVGAPAYSIGANVAGAAFLFTGSASGIASVGAGAATERFAGVVPSAFFGSTLALAGDLNGDAIGDLAIGSPFLGNGESGEGAAFVFLPEPGAAAGLAFGSAALIAIARSRARSRSE